MNKFEVDLNDMAFDSHGQQVGVEVPADMLDEISGGRSTEVQLDDGNGLCGAGCGNGDNSVCGLSCLG